MATLEELLRQARLDLDDPLFNDSDEDCRWSDDELVDYVNRAMDEACLRARLIEDTGVAPWSKITVKAGKADYKLDGRVLRIRRARMGSDPRPLTKVGTNDLDWYYYDWESQTGTPEFYLQDTDSKSLKLVPTPEADDTLVMTVQRRQKYPLRLDDDGCEPEIPQEHHYKLLDWVYHLAFSRRDDDTYDQDNADRHEAAFEDSFGTRPTAEDLVTIRRERAARVRGRYF